MSFIGNIPDAHDFFMHKAGIDTKWPTPKKRGHQPSITLTQEDGYSVIHGHPLNGTKFFVRAHPAARLINESSIC